MKKKEMKEKGVMSNSNQRLSFVTARKIRFIKNSDI